ncbi:MAG: serine/threonine protein kinase [Archangiaceae bacterium]|nr:serine/threonine protein kinase [Archangiaceae bacterium]
MSLREHEQVAGYRLVRRIGRGGMAEVWRATPVGAAGAADVALKVMELDETDPEHRATQRRFEEEVRLGQRLVHSNLVRTLEGGVDRERAWVALELLEGRTLRQLLAERGPLPLPAALGVGLQLLAALEHVHGMAGEDGRPLQLVHRDLKPSNVFVTDAGVVKVIDFGIAVIGNGDQTRTRTGTLRGSVPYCSPEQVQQQPLDARSDLYAVGLILHELLTAQRCFPQESDAALLNAILWEPLRPAREQRPELPVELDRLLLALAHKQRERRPADARAARERLLALAEKTGAFAPAELAAWLRSPPAGPRADATRSLRAGPGLALAPARRRWPLPLGVALAAVLLALGVSRALPGRAPPPVAAAAGAPAAPLAVPAAPAPDPAPPAAAEPPPRQAKVPAPVQPARRPVHAAKAPAKAEPAGAGWLNVGMKGGWAQVSVDGRDAGPTPVFRLVLPAGPHRLEALRQDGARTRREVTVRAGLEETVVLDFRGATP